MKSKGMQYFLLIHTVNEKVPNDANNFNENGIIEIIVHPVFNAINQLFKQSPSSIKSLMDVALSQSDSNWLQFQDSYDAPWVAWVVGKKADAKQAINPFSERHQIEDLKTMN